MGLEARKKPFEEWLRSRVASALDSCADHSLAEQAERITVADTVKSLLTNRDFLDDALDYVDGVREVMSK